MASDSLIGLELAVRFGIWRTRELEKLMLGRSSLHSKLQTHKVFQNGGRVVRALWQVSWSSCKRQTPFQYKF